MNEFAKPRTTLVIRHIAGTKPASFEILRFPDGKTVQTGSPPSPFIFPVEGRPQSHLMAELRWYLEEFLNYPFAPETYHADRVLNALKEWGERAFETLFLSPSATGMLDSAVLQNYSDLHLRIASDDPGILAWPWEALRDRKVGVLGQVCQIERALNGIRDLHPLASSLPRDRINVLMVVSRPFGPDDVGFRTIARPLVELIEKQNLPVNVRLLRPPTFDKLLAHLREKPNFYHIVHFDGHGSFSATNGVQGEYGGQLVFETSDGQPDPVSAEKLSTLLTDCAVPAVVLNACQSAMLDPDSEDAFASVATALLRAGIRSVVAMSYSLYVSAAEKFLPAFYNSLLQEGSVARAVRIGRQKMWQDDKRVCIRGSYPLQDWLLPVLYQQDPLTFRFAEQELRPMVEKAVSLGMKETHEPQNAEEFVGRDSAILQMERALRRPAAGILIQGLGGVGKTTLVRSFVQWLTSTGGLNSNCLWFSFREIRSARYMLNRLGEALLGVGFARLPQEKGMDALAAILRDQPRMIVWDNFESASGVPDALTSRRLPEGDRQLLGQFLEKLRGGATKVVITSRSDEDWLGPRRRFLLRLRGLDSQERWEYLDRLVRELGLTVDRDDPALLDLMSELQGHPLGMRSILPLLEKRRAEDVLNALRENVSALASSSSGSDDATLYATLQLVENSVPQAVRHLLTLLALHRGYFSLPHLKMMAETSGNQAAQIDTLIKILTSLGVVTHVGGDIYEMHPLLGGYLTSVFVPKQSTNKQAPLIRAFVEVNASMANAITFAESTQQAQAYYFLGANIRSALSNALTNGTPINVGALMQCLAALAQNARDFDGARELYEVLGAHARSIRSPQAEASPHYQLGRVADAQGDFVAAEERYRLALALYQEAEDLTEVAHTYNTIGHCTAQQENYEVAQDSYEAALKVLENFSNDSLTAMALHGLGVVAQKRQNLDEAERLYTKALRLEKQQHAIAAIYHQMGRVAQERGQYEQAQAWFLKSLETDNRDEIDIASTKYQLAIVASQRNDLVAARQWCTSCLIIAEKWNDRQLSAEAYGVMGVITLQEGDFEASEQWFRKAISIAQENEMHRTLATAYRHLGILSGRKRLFIESGEWLIKARLTASGLKDDELIEVISDNFAVTLEHAGPGEKSALATMWLEAGLGSLPSKSPKRQQQSVMAPNASSVPLQSQQ